MYLGEVQILHDDLDRFLNTAQRFKLSGLIANKSEDGYVSSNDYSIEVPELVKDENQYERKVAIDKPIKMNLPENTFQSNFSEYIEELADGNYHCITCGKVTSGKLKYTRLTSMKHHIEIHIDGLSYPCSKCEQTFRTKQIYKNHLHRFHK